MASCLLMTGWVVAGNPGLAPESGHRPWQLISETRAGRIYHRDVEGSSIPMAMVVTQFESSPATLYAVVTDYEHFEDFIPNVVESRVIRASEGFQWVFHRLHFPGPVADRVYVIRSQKQSGRIREGWFRVTWQLAAGMLAEVDTARGIEPESFSGFWDLRPLGDGKTVEARYAVHSDPAGFIPVWLVVKMTDRYLQQVVTAVRERLGYR
ncbi:MAG: SRPBCC family protein [Pseudomonadota bacterium]|nr:SRPBCC family protein [Pseudomonadota bacterium]